MHWLRKSTLLALMMEMLSLFMPASQVVSVPTCTSMYGNPARADCAAALNRLPRDSTFHYFVEQQMRTAPPAAS